ncbi:MAG: magnesium/cobalt transporter CorA [Bacteroidia bacterium]
MIRLFYLQQGTLVREKNPELLRPASAEKIIWVDLQNPTREEQALIERTYGVEFQTPQETSEIESSSRYYEDNETIEANSTFIIFENKAYVAKQISFILQQDILFTLRHGDSKTFAETVRKMKSNTLGVLRDGMQILLTLLETRIDFDADFIEYLTKTTTQISRKMLREREIEQDSLFKIAELQENTILIRESITDKQRLVSSLLRSTYVKESEKERLRIIVKDIGSLLQHTEFGFERLEYLQNSFLGLVNLEQNQIIKIFTVVSVIFMPPTLIASLYGMNFDFMPELHWKLGYPLALLMMVASSLMTLWYFRRRKWL